MKGLKSLIGKIISGLIVVFVLSIVLKGQDNRQLYLVTGYTTNTGPLKVSSRLFRVNSISRALEYVLELVNAKEGSLSTNADHERRVVAVVSGSNQAVVLSMDAPTAPRRFPISYDGSLFLTSFVDLPGSGVALALETLGSARQSLSGINLAPLDSAATQQNLAWENYRFVRKEGWWSPGDQKPYGGAIQLWIREGKAITRQTTSLSEKQMVEVEMPIPIPKEAASQTDDRAWRLIINNDEISVLMRLFGQSGVPGVKGETRLYIFDKKSQSWHTEDFEGGGSSLRGFGSWVVVNQGEFNRVVVNGNAQFNPDQKESPGRLLRQRILNPEERPQEQATLDSLFQGDLNYFPGIIHLYDVRSGRRYRMDTGQGDSEVLLVDGTTLYYRVNDTLYRAEIGTSTIQNSVEIAKDENVQLAHWAFLANK